MSPSNGSRRDGIAAGISADEFSLNAAEFSDPHASTQADLAIGNSLADIAERIRSKREAIEAQKRYLSELEYGLVKLRQDQRRLINVRATKRRAAQKRAAKERRAQGNEAQPPADADWLVLPARRAAR